MSVKMGIGFSPLTEAVYIGKQNKKKSMWAGNDKRDITNDFIGVMFQYVEPNTARTISSGKGINIFMNVKSDEASINKAIRYLKKQLKKNKK